MRDLKSTELKHVSAQVAAAARDIAKIEAARALVMAGRAPAMADGPPGRVPVRAAAADQARAEAYLASSGAS